MESVHFLHEQVFGIGRPPHLAVARSSQVLPLRRIPCVDENNTIGAGIALQSRDPTPVRRPVAFVHTRPDWVRYPGLEVEYAQLIPVSVQRLPTVRRDRASGTAAVRKDASAQSAISAFVRIDLKNTA